jgi:hypothetical protein
MRNAIVPSLLFPIAFFLVTGFIAGFRFDFPYRKVTRPKVFLLQDVSRSLTNTNPSLFVDPRYRKLTADRNVVVIRFSDRPSKDGKGLDTGKTALADSVNRLMEENAGNNVFVVLSDFQDNASVSTEFLRKVDISVLAGRPTADGLAALANVAFDEYVQAGERNDAAFRFFTLKKDAVTLTASADGRTIARRKVASRPGWNLEKLPVILEGDRFRKVDFRLETRSVSGTVYPGVSRMVRSLDHLWKFFVCAGRPSPEYSYFHRFFNRMRFLRTDSRILIGQNERAALPSPDSCDALVLIDLADRQIENPQTISAWLKSGKPVLYLPGIREYAECRTIFGALGVALPMDDVQESKFLLGSREMTVKTAFDVPALISRPLSNVEVRFAWDTWKWKSLSEASGVEDSAYEDYWRDALLFLSGKTRDEQRAIRLNWIAGEGNPSGDESPGEKICRTNGAEYRILVEKPDMEERLAFNDEDYARRVSERTVTLEEFLRDFQVRKALARKGTRVEKSMFRLDFRKFPALLPIVIILLLTAWLLSDLHAARS